jgi:Tfp pilus assembly protein PilE
MKLKRYYQNPGFSIIEVLIITSVIAILSFIILVPVQIAREKASDAIETSNLDQVRIALEMYYYDEGEYVIDTFTHPLHCTIDGGNVCIDCSSSYPDYFLKQLEDKGFFTRQEILHMFGHDVGNSKLKACYHYSIDRQRYKIVAVLYNEEIMKNDGGISDNHYEVGGDLSLPFSISTTY